MQSENSELRDDLEALYEGLERGWCSFGADQGTYGRGGGCLGQQMSKVAALSMLYRCTQSGEWAWTFAEESLARINRMATALAALSMLYRCTQSGEWAWTPFAEESLARINRMATALGFPSVIKRRENQADCLDITQIARWNDRSTWYDVKERVKDAIGKL